MKTTRAAPVAIVAITLLAFALRVCHLSGQSLWYDEGFSVYLAQKSLAEITTRTAADIQPPVYYYLLHAWMALSGRGEFAVRFLSVVFGALTIPLVYHLARRLLSPLAGMLTALLVAVSPFHIWYAQETRMYTLVTLLGVLSSWMLVRLLAPSRQQARPALWLAYALVNVVAVYTHYYAFFVVAFQALYLIYWRLRGGRPAATLVLGLAAQAATMLAYLPWASFALNRYAVDESYWQGALSLDFVRKTLLAFSTGHTVYEAQAQVIALGFVALAVVGVAAIVSRRRNASPPGLGDGGNGTRAAIFLLLYLIVPFALLYVLSAGRPKFNPRYLMLASPPFFVLIAAGLERLLAARRALPAACAVAGLFFVLGASGYALANNLTNHVYVRDDFRSVAARIAAARQADEAVILCSGHMFPVYSYYAPGGEVYRIPDSETLSTRAVVTYDVSEKLNEVAAGHGGVWLVLWQDEVADPTGILTSLLDAQAERVPEANIYWGIELRHYRLPQGVRFVAPQMAALPNINFANKLSLIGLGLATPDVVSGESITLTLFWQAQQALDDDYWLSLRLINPLGHVVSALNDRPAGYAYPTTRWQPRVTTPGSFRLPVMPGTAPGEYKLQVIVFSLGRAQNLDVLDERGAPAGAGVLIGAVSVRAPAQPPPVESLGLASILRLPMGGDMELAATSLGDRSVRQGETLSFAIAWRNGAPVAKDHVARLRLVAGGKTLYEVTAPLAATDYPTSRWPAGSIVRSQYELTIPADAPAQVQVEVGLDGAGAPQVMARLAVSQVARTTAVPAMQFTQKAQFGALARLLGYDVAPLSAKPGETIALTLYWQAGVGDGQSLPYTVFTHLLGADQLIYAQHDSPPAEGARPTTGWLPGEIIVDRHLLVVKPDAPAGEYVLEIGLYEPGANRRLDATTEDDARGDHVILTRRVRVGR